MRKIYTFVAAIVLGMVVCWLLGGCSPRIVEVERPVVVEQTHTQTHTDIVRDTLIMRDSVYHYVQGDTTIIERWHHTQGVTNIYKVDTLHIYDSVPYPVEVTKERIVTKVEEVNVLRWWQKLLMVAGGLALIALGLFGAYKIGKR